MSADLDNAVFDDVFHQLDEPRHLDLEEALRADPEMALRAARFRHAVALLLDDEEEFELPHRLAERTVALVERRKSRPHPADLLPTRAPFRLADLAVAATVFFAAILTLSVPILRSRAQMDQASCAFNLQKVGLSLAKYSTSHGSYPVVSPSVPVGAYGSMLQDAHALNDPAILVCPACARMKPQPALLGYDQVRKLAARSPESVRTMFDGHFAYNVGHLRPSGEIVPPPADNPSANLPIVSDGPPWTPEGGVREGNSPNHGGRGQNVLFNDGHVSFLRNRWISDRDHDIFLNEAKLPAPGLHPGDSALVPSALPVRPH